MACPSCGSTDTEVRCYRAPVKHFEQRCNCCHHRWPIEQAT